MCTPQMGSRTSSRPLCSAFKSPVGFNGSRVRWGCSRAEINRPARRTPHETITTRNKNLINRARKVIAYSAIRVVTYLQANNDERIPIGAGGKATRPIARNSPKDAVHRVYARSKGCVKRKGVISVSCEDGPQGIDQPNNPKRCLKLILFLKL
jgi:hypothetical protein